jgi:mRNA interferase HicA
VAGGSLPPGATPARLPWGGGSRERRSPREGGLVSIAKCNTSVTVQGMNSKQMRKWLEQQGATFVQGRGSHLKVFLNGRQSALPMHGTQELGKGIEAAIKRQLGLK